MDREDPRCGKGLIDLIVVIGIVLMALGLTYWAPSWLAPLRVGLGLVSALFVPGYVTLTAVIPHLNTRNELIPWKRVENSLDQSEQIILSVILSIVIVPILGIVVSFTSLGIRPITMVLTVGGYSILVACIAAIRRLFFTSTAMGFLHDNTESWISRLRDRRTKADLVLNLLVVFLILIGGLVLAAPPPEQDVPQFTEFYVLNEDEPSDLNMTDYPHLNGSSDPAPVVTGITNHEHQAIEYTVIVQVQRAEVRERSVAVLDRNRINTVQIRLEHGESARIPYEFRSPEAQTGCRVAFLLYRGDPPSSPTLDNAYRELHLWDTANPPPDQTGCSDPDAIDVTTDPSSIAVSDKS